MQFIKSLFLVSFLAIFSVSFNANAQKYQGLVHSNFSSVQGMFYNPAKLAQTRSKFSVELFGVNGFANNNVYKISKDSLLNGNFGYTNTNSNEPVNFTAPMLDVHLPSFQFKLNNKLSFGISSGLRVFNQVNQLSPTLLSFYTNASSSAALPTAINDPKGFNFNINAMADIGLSAGLNLLDNDKMAFNVGATLRRYSGIGYVNFNNKGIVGSLIQNASPTPDFVNVTNINFDISSSAYNFNQLQNDLRDPKKAFDNIFKAAAGSGFGGDIGAELIIKTKRKKMFKGAYSPYLLKLGASIQDVGSLSYNNVKQIKISGSGLLNNDSLETYNSDLAKMRTYLKSRGLLADSFSIAVKNKLPTTLNLYADYALSNKFFISAAAQISMVSVDDRNPYYYNQFTIAPRFESKTIELSVPITYSTLSKDVKLGAAARLAILYFGSDDLSMLFNDSKGGNFYLGVKINVNKKKQKEKKPKKEDAEEN